MAVAAPARRSQSQTARRRPPAPHRRSRRNVLAIDPARRVGSLRDRRARHRAETENRLAETARRHRGSQIECRGARPQDGAEAPHRRSRHPDRRRHRRSHRRRRHQLPESGLIHRLTRGRAWIGVLGVLLIGIVGLNVVTLSFAASAGKVDERIQALSREELGAAEPPGEENGQAQINREAKKQGSPPRWPPSRSW